MPFPDYVRAAVCEPLGLTLDPSGHAGSGMRACLADVLAFGRELLEPRLVAPETHDEMVAVQFPGLDGVLPDFGRFNPLDWGLGVELKGTKQGHWSGSLTSPRMFGHFGGSGTFLWVDPVQGLACAALTTRRFGDWAKVAWPLLSDAVIQEYGAARTTGCSLSPRRPASAGRPGRAFARRARRDTLAGWTHSQASARQRAPGSSVRLPVRRRRSLPRGP
jgi:CubicO group peptidase (beta-lactamase class C family)